MNETVVTIDRSIAPPTAGAPKPAPPAATTTTTTTTGNNAGCGGVLSWVQFNYQYFLYTIPGYLKIAQLVGFIIMSVVLFSILFWV